MDQVDIDKIKDRIAKLLRMAQDSSSPNEAAIAAGRARALMDKYQIDESDVNGDIADKFGTARATRNYVNVPSFMQTLAVAVAVFNDCQVRFEYEMDHVKKKETKFMQFCGFGSDVEICLSMFNSLKSCIERLCKEYLVKIGLTGRYPRDIGEAFKIACSVQVVNRLNAISEARDRDTSEGAGIATGKGLVLVKKRERVEEEFGEATYRNLTHKAKTEETFLAAAAGKREGSLMKLQDTVDAEG